MDKQNLGVVSLNNFNKVTKMFGIGLNPGEIDQSNNGMVDY